MRPLTVLSTALLAATWSLASHASGPERAGQGSFRLTGKPYVDMDYGPYLTATLEASPGNMAYKGVAIRLDSGPGGVSQGKAFVLFDTDLLRYAVGWTGEGFIDWRGIALDGQHNAHPRIVGSPVFANPAGPGWADPHGGGFNDPRLRGLDDQPYGPLPRPWAHWKGLFLHQDKVVLSYTVGDASVAELPGLVEQDGQTVFLRTLQIDGRGCPLLLQVCGNGSGDPQVLAIDGLRPGARDGSASGNLAILPFEETAAAGQLDFGSSDFTISAWIKTATGGTILSKAAPRGKWVPQGKCFFVRGGRLGYDVGWLGVVQSQRGVADDRWHHVAVTYRSRDGLTSLFIDGQAEGAKPLKSPDGQGQVVRIGYTASDFMPPFRGELDEVQVFGRELSREEIRAAASPDQRIDGVIARWTFDNEEGSEAKNAVGGGYSGRLVGARRGPGRFGAAIVLDGSASIDISGKGPPPIEKQLDRMPSVVAVGAVGDTTDLEWVFGDGRNVRLKIPASSSIRRVKLLIWRGPGGNLARFSAIVRSALPPGGLTELTKGGAPRWDERLTTQATLGEEDGPFAIDTLELPVDNPWRSWLRLGGLDFFRDARRAAVCTWQGDVWTVDGIGGHLGTLTWQRMATGMFQPLGLRIVDDQVYVLGRDQITRLVDLNGDGEADFYENFNNDAQVTEHFHEFAMDLQTDEAGNFYYMKGGRHALPALVPQHGSLIKVSRDGQESQILAKGFRAPNGLLVNGDGTFISSDQEGHWTPMNRINWIRPGGFYGYMMSYVPEKKETSHDPPVCWVHKNVDRSPAAQVWVPSDAWGPLGGALLSLSYGTGRIWNVLHERVGEVQQGGVVRLPVPALPTGIQRGRFHPIEGQLYVCGLFGWSSDQTLPGGLYRVRRTAGKLDLPVGLSATKYGMLVTFARELDPNVASDAGRYSVHRWEYRRTADYGSDDYRLSDGKPGHDRVSIAGVQVSSDRRSVFIRIPDMRPCMQMEIKYNLRAEDGAAIAQTIHHTINVLHDPATLAAVEFPGGLVPPSPLAEKPLSRDELQQGLALTIRSGDTAAGPADVKAARLLALYVPRGGTPSPLLAPGPLAATWEGYLDAELSDEYTFYARGQGQLQLFVNGAEVLRAAGRNGLDGEAKSQPVPLRSGLNDIRAEFRGPDDGRDAVLRVDWSSGRFARELIGPQALWFNPKTTEIDRFERLHDGRKLFAIRSCWRCHGLPAGGVHGDEAMPELERDNPSLAGAGERFNGDWLFQWILAPHSLANRVSMPGLFGPARDPAVQRDAADVAAYLSSLATVPESAAVEEVFRDGTENGEVLYEDLGCIACHRFDPPQQDDPFDRTSLYYVAAKFKPGSLAAFLRAPHRYYRWSRMPDFQLSETEAAALAGFLRAKARGGIGPVEQLAGADAERGKRLFDEVGCGNCHTVHNGAEQELALARQAAVFGARPAAGCVGDGTARDVGKHVPDYQFTKNQRAALSAFLATDGQSLYRRSYPDASSRALDRLKCAACHDRDGQRSARPEITIEEGLQGQPPEVIPSLTWAGEKLQANWTERLLAGQLPHRSRPWMKARMPAFPVHARTIARGLAAEHGVAPQQSLVFKFDPVAAEVGYRLSLKEGGFNCIQCHSVGDREAEAPFDSRGIDFVRIAERLRYDYYRSWIFDPLRLNPQSKMPQFSPDRRKTSLTHVYDGDAGAQFDALWHYLQSLQGDERGPSQ